MDVLSSYMYIAGISNIIYSSIIHLPFPFAVSIK